MSKENKNNDNEGDDRVRKYEGVGGKARTNERIEQDHPSPLRQARQTTLHSFVRAHLQSDDGVDGRAVRAHEPLIEQRTLVL